MPRPTLQSEIVWNLSQSIKQLTGPLEQICREQQDNGEAVNGEKLVFDALLWAALYASQLDGHVAKDEIVVTAAVIAPLFEGLRSLGFPSRERIGQLVVETIANRAVLDISADKPLLLQYLKNYDEQTGATTRNIAIGMLFRLANAICKADGTVKEEEHNALLSFRDNLFGTTSQERSTKWTPKLGSLKSPQTSTALDHPTASKDLESSFEELNSLVGLESVKREVTQLVNFLKVQQLRHSKGLPAPVVSRHLVFLGKPGTGKTTVARLIAQIYRELGILSKGHLVETDRSGLVAGYLGQTALRVKEVAASAQGGILFIDEAYALVSESGQDSYGQEAIDVLLKIMEDQRDELVVIVAGYTDKMQSFLTSNPGLASRFNKHITFEDYTPEKLVQVFEWFSEQSSYKVDDLARSQLLGTFAVLYEKRSNNFGNARLARNMFEAAINRQANRVVSLTDISVETLTAITSSDIPGALEMQDVRTG